MKGEAEIVEPKREREPFLKALSTVGFRMKGEAEIVEPKREREPFLKALSTVGFEPTPPKRMAPKATALDHSAKSTIYPKIDRIT